MERQTHEPDAPRAQTSGSATVAQPLRVTSYGLSDRGHKREQNEDQFLIAEISRAMQIVGSSLPQPATAHSLPRVHVFAVADGMGGYHGGAHASAYAVKAIERFLLDTPRLSTVGANDQALPSEFQAALTEADARLFATGMARPELSGMGTTFTAAWYQESNLCVLHVGDSRCYLARGENLYQLTQDHTVVAELVRRGVITPQDAAHHSMRHVITNVVGGPSPGVRVEVHRTQIEAGDSLLLCSDGLTEMVPEATIREVMTTEREPKAACERLIKSALDAGGRDNVTVVVARFDGA